jgi:hypothetical protein
MAMMQLPKSQPFHFGSKSMRCTKNVVNGLTVVFFCTLTLMGCGGGGGGSTASGLSYDGVTTPAVINQANARELTLDAIDGGEFGSVATEGASTLRSVGNDISSRSLDAKDVSATVRKLSFSISRLDFGRFPSALTAATEIEPVAGPCGGDISGVVDVDVSTGDVSATLIYSDYKGYDLDSLDSCGAGTGSLTNGTVSMSSSSEAALSQQPGTSLSFEFSTLTVVEEDSDMSMSGTVVLAIISAEQSRMTLNMVAKDNIAGETIKMDDYVSLVTNSASYKLEEIGGHFYNSEHGYVNIETITSLETATGSEWPRAGVVRFDGAEGSTVTVTFGATSAIGIGSDSQGNAIEFEYVYGSG